MLGDKRVIALNLSFVTAGAKYRGEFEERITGIMDELKTAKYIVLLINEIHTIVLTRSIGKG